MNNSELNLQITEIKTFVPAKDFDLSLVFYNNLGFSTVWNNNELALLDKNGFKFLLQRFYKKELAENFMMHLLVQNIDDWWQHVNQITTHNLQLTKPEDRSWGIRDFTFLDPSGVLWRIGTIIEN